MSIQLPVVLYFLRTTVRCSHDYAQRSIGPLSPICMASIKGFFLYKSIVILYGTVGTAPFIFFIFYNAMYDINHVNKIHDSLSQNRKQVSILKLFLMTFCHQSEDSSAVAAGDAIHHLTSIAPGTLNHLHLQKKNTEVSFSSIQ